MALYFDLGGRDFMEESPKREWYEERDGWKRKLLFIWFILLALYKMWDTAPIYTSSISLTNG